MPPKSAPNTKPSFHAVPTPEEAKAAVETLLRWAGEDPSREGLKETPQRVIDAFREYFAGYQGDPAAELGKTFEDIEFDDIVLVRDIDFVSHCEHHMAAIQGKAHVAYWPSGKVVGISKFARVVDIYARRLISQENMTTSIANIIQQTLKPKGVAIMITADHQCMSIRGVKKPGSATTTSTFTGIFKTDETVQRRFMEMIK